MAFGCGFSIPAFYGAASGLGMFASASLYLDFTSGNQTLDSRVTFTRSSAATRTNAQGLIESVSTDQPRFDYDPVTLQPKGLLIEEQRTNYIRNNTMQGAVAGTPGTLPTNWQQALFSNLSSSIVGVGTEDGVTYIDYRIYGTANASSSCSLQFEQNSAVSAASGQTWSLSTYLKIVAGSTSGISSIRVGWEERSNVYLQSDQSSTFTPESTNSLAANRNTYSFTLSNASTTFIKPYIQFTPINGAAIDLTLRLGLPQLEQGAFATSVIPTTTAQVTRAADVATMTGTNFSSWYNQTEGTLFAEAEAGANGSTTYVVLSDGNQTGNSVYFDNDNGIMRNVVFSGSSAVSVINLGAIGTVGASNKVACAYKVNDFAAVRNSGSVGVDTLGAVPVNVSQMRLGSNVGGVAAAYLNGHIKRIAYFPKRLSNTELQGITA